MHTMEPRPHLFSYFFVLQRTNPRNRSLILAILQILAILINPGHPASDAINIKVLTDLFCLFRRRAIDIQVLSDLALSLGWRL